MNKETAILIKTASSYFWNTESRFFSDCDNSVWFDSSVQAISIGTTYIWYYIHIYGTTYIYMVLHTYIQLT